MVKGIWDYRKALAASLLFALGGATQTWGLPCSRELTERARAIAPLAPLRLSEVLQNLPEEKIKYFVDLVETLEWVTDLKPKAMAGFASGLRNFGYNSSRRGRTQLINDLSPLYGTPLPENIAPKLLALLNQFPDVPSLPPLDANAVATMEAFVMAQARTHLAGIQSSVGSLEQKLDFLRDYAARFFRYDEYLWKMCLEKQQCDAFKILDNGFRSFAAPLFESSPPKAALLYDVLKASLLGEGCELSGEKLKAKWVHDLETEILRVASLVATQPSSGSKPSNATGKPSDAARTVAKTEATKPHQPVGRSRSRLKKIAGTESIAPVTPTAPESTPNLPPLTPEIRAALLQAVEQIRPDHPAPFAATERLLTRILGAGRRSGSSHIVFPSPLSERRIFILVQHGGRDILQAKTNDLVRLLKNLIEAYGIEKTP